METTTDKAKLNLNESSYDKGSQEILDQAKKGLGFVPNMYEKMAHNFSLLSLYTSGYDTFRKHSGFSPVEQEVVFLSVAYENECTYCVAAHSFVGDHMTNVPKEVTNAIRNNEQVPDTKLAALSKFAKKMTRTRGNVSQNDLEEFLAAGYQEKHVLGVITGIAVKTLSNYSNHLTHPELDDAFAGRKWSKS